MTISINILLFVFMELYFILTNSWHNNVCTTSCYRKSNHFYSLQKFEKYDLSRVLEDKTKLWMALAKNNTTSLVVKESAVYQSIFPKAKFSKFSWSLTGI